MKSFWELSTFDYFESRILDADGRLFDAPSAWLLSDGAIGSSYQRLTLRFMRKIPPRPDYMTWGALQIVSDQLRNAILASGKSEFEFLPIDIQNRFQSPVTGMTLWLFHRTKVLDCIDYSKSELEFWSDRPPRLVKKVESLAFDEKRVGNACIFVPAGLPFVFCTNELAEAIRVLNLRVHLLAAADFRLGC